MAAAVREMKNILSAGMLEIEDIWQVLYRGGFYRGGPKHERYSV